MGEEEEEAASRGPLVCAKLNGDTCRVFGCKESGNAHECLEGKCRCGEDDCAVDGACVPEEKAACSKDTHGTCAVFPCRKSRGDVICEKDKCLCNMNSCAVDGKCVPEDEADCSKDTGGTCGILSSCHESRGDTSCDHGK